VGPCEKPEEPEGDEAAEYTQNCQGQRHVYAKPNKPRLIKLSTVLTNTPQAVGDQNLRHEVKFLEWFAHQFERKCLIPLGLDQHPEPLHRHGRRARDRRSVH
jgi:hypothetical protein